MKLITAVTAMLFFTTAAVAQTPVEPAITSPAQQFALSSQPGGRIDPRDLEIFLDGLMSDQMRASRIVGATLAVVENGEVVLAKGYGFANLDKKQRVEASTTLFRPGSISKLFTYTAVMQLVERGLLDLDQEANTYLKEFQIPDTFPEPIRLRHLINHTAGFENTNIATFAPSQEYLLPLSEALQHHVPARVRPVDEVAAYSNYGVTLAGLIVATVSGLSFDDYIEENILKPLGMNDSTFAEPLPARLEPNMSQGFYFYGGVQHGFGFEWIHNVGPAGSLTSTATDMAKFMIAHLQNGRYGSARILREETAVKMHSQSFANDPRLPGMAHGFKEGEVNGMRVLQHRGDSRLFHSDLQLFPQQNLGIFVSYNSPITGGEREAVVKGIIERYFEPADLPAVTPPADFAERAEKYLGDYVNMNRAYTTFEKFEELNGGGRRTVSLMPNNTLFINAGYLSSQYVEIGPNLFRQVDGGEKLAFREDADGNITHFFLGSWPAASIDRLPDWYNPGNLRCALWVCLLLYLWFLRRLWVNRRAPHSALKQHGWVVWTAVVVGVLQLTFFFGFTHLFQTHANSIYQIGLPSSMKALLVLPIIAAVLSAGMTGFGVLAWVRGYWTAGFRLLFTLVVLAALFMVWFTHFFNLLGFHY